MDTFDRDIKVAKETGIISPFLTELTGLDEKEIKERLEMEKEQDRRLAKLLNRRRNRERGAIEVLI